MRWVVERSYTTSNNADGERRRMADDARHAGHSFFVETPGRVTLNLSIHLHLPPARDFRGAQMIRYFAAVLPSILRKHLQARENDGPVLQEEMHGSVEQQTALAAINNDMMYRLSEDRLRCSSPGKNFILQIERNRAYS